MEKLDKETSAIIQSQEKVYHLTEHEGWPLVKQMLMERIDEFYDTRNVVGKNATEKGKSLEIRTAVAKEMYAWLADIDGSVNAYATNRTLKEKESYILREQ